MGFVDLFRKLWGWLSADGSVVTLNPPVLGTLAQSNRVVGVLAVSNRAAGTLTLSHRVAGTLTQDVT